MSSEQRKPSRRGHGHRWTKFELDTVLGLICKGEHLRSSDLGFATKLNKALNGSGNSDSYVDDITVEDVRRLLTTIETERKGSLAFIERQPEPRLMTRIKKRMFERGLRFTGSPQEWAAGRRDEWLAAKEMQEADSRAGIQSSIEGGQSSHLNRWIPAAARAVVPDDRKTGNWGDGSYVTTTSIPWEQSSPRASFGWTQEASSGGMTTPYGPFHPQTPMIPPNPVPRTIPTPMGAGWTVPNAITPLPNMAPVAHQSWPVDHIQAQINAITATPAQPVPIRQQYGSGWTTNPATSQGRDHHRHNGAHARRDRDHK